MSENKDPKELWNEFNTIEVEELLNYTTASLINEAYRLSSENEKENLQKETDLAWTIHIMGNWLEHFEPDLKQINEAIDNFVAKHSENLSYYKTRLEEVKTVLLKWHYAIGCYLLEKGTHLIVATKLILKSAEKSLDKENFLNSIKLLVTAYNLNKIYKLNLSNDINAASLNLIKKLKDKPRYLIEPSEVIAKLQIVNKEDLSKLIKLLISKTEEEHNHIVESLLRTVITLCDLDKKNQDETKKEIILRLARKFEEEGDKQTEGLLMIHHYEKAQKEYQRLNDNEKINQLSQKIKNSYEHIHWKTITQKFTLPKLDIPGKNGFEKISSIANFVDMIPDVDKTERLVEELNKKYPLHSLFPSTSFSKKQPTSHNKTDEEIKQSQIKGDFIRTITLMESILSVSVESLENDKQITVDDYVDYIKSFGLHDETTIEIIKHGIERHLAKDFISSIHNLIPQIEYTVRQLLELKGIHTTRIENDIICNVLLGTLISRGSIFFGENLTRYLRIKFTDNDAMNQRNNICHAYTDLSDFDHKTSLSLIYVIMMLTKLVFEK
ncbi:MAG: DUF4209 domain-containing protein [Nitrosopumilus sp.]|nr:DUF4209 domain-containing protein [Nitrosopumilus sp.]